MITDAGDPAAAAAAAAASLRRTDIATTVDAPILHLDQGRSR
jgi:hypothetical protein